MVKEAKFIRLEIFFAKAFQNYYILCAENYNTEDKIIFKIFSTPRQIRYSKERSALFLP